MVNFFAERLKQIAQPDQADPEGGTVSFWFPRALVLEIEHLATSVGISKSALVRELLTIAIPMAQREIDPGIDQQTLFGEELPFRTSLGAELAASEHAARAKQSGAGRRTTPRKKRTAKRPRKAVAPRSRGKRG